MTDSPLITNAMKGALLGAALGYFEDLDLEASACGAERPSVRSVRRWNRRAHHALLRVAEERGECRPIVIVPPSPVVTKGYFAGSPRPLYHTQDAREHRR